MYTNSILEVELDTPDQTKLELPPLIKIEVLLNNVLKTTGIYDPGSNVAVINSKLIILKNKEKNLHGSTLKSINGRGKTNGLITLKAKILDDKNDINAFILESDNFDHDLILGLDTIKNFGLTHDENLNIKKLNKNLNLQEIKHYNNNRYKEESKEEQEIEKVFKEYEVNCNEGIDASQFTIDTENLDSGKKK